MTLILSRNPLLYIEPGAFKDIYLRELDIRSAFASSAAQKAGLQALYGLNVKKLMFGKFSYDEAWVINELMENLENGVPPIQLCLHMRDFQAGKSITSNIIDEGIMGSRKIIVVVSQHFIDSDWCRFEFELAQSRFMMERNANIIIIILEDVEEKKTKKVLGLHKHLKKNTYDEVWVMNELMENLENGVPPIQLCLHMRDFQAGKSIASNIIDEGIMGSRKIIVVVSQHFIDSAWCRFEFELAQSRFMMERNANIIIIILEDVEERKTKKVLGLHKHLKKNTYLKWSRDPLTPLGMYFSFATKSWQSLSAPSGYEDLSKVTLAPHHTFDDAKKAIFDLKVQLEDVSKEEVNKISSAVKEVKILQTVDPSKREEFLEYSCQLTMDTSTAHPNLHLSDRNTVVRMSNEPKSYPEHPDRFEYWQQVLCKEGLASGRYYWEVDWSGSEIDIGVTYRGIQRKGNSNAGSFGGNDKSWSLYCSESKYSFVHNSKSTTIPVPNSSRIGVYVDYEAGIMAFYSVSDTMKLLHKVQARFTEPLYPGLGVWGYGTTVRL
ncbi:tripartite motif-containing 16-like protein [Labeo rohita]|uniref:Tripartite motif-containing 16-like protein n=1 Tax=Labeo rohita TaxID=84645 RepID=A0A498N897_LABRO|nr:tripartite motif-containing 16-like protein [Labeo rohita]